MIKKEIQLKNPKDRWLIFGLNGYLSDNFREKNLTEYKIYLAKKFEFFNKKIALGREIFPIFLENSQEKDNFCNFPFVSEQEYMEIFQLKCTLIFHMISALGNCKKFLIANTMFFLKDHLVNTDLFIKKIKSTLGLKTMKYFYKQFIQSTGVPKISLKYNYSRKENKLSFNINQVYIIIF